MPYNPNIPQDDTLIKADELREQFRQLKDDRIVDSDKVDGKHQQDLANVDLSNVTDNVILNKIKNVDGQNSGLDQDLLDGNHQSYFANTSLSNVTDSTLLNKIKNVDGQNSGLDQDLLDGKHQQDLANVDLSNVSDQVLLQRVQNIGGTGSLIDADTVDGKHQQDLAYVNLSNVQDNVLLNKIKNVDGSGSGLDQDLLDGKDSTQFVQKTGDTMSGNLIVNGTVQTTGLKLSSSNRYLKKFFQDLQATTSSFNSSNYGKYNIVFKQSNSDCWISSKIRIDGSYHSQNANGVLEVEFDKHSGVSIITGWGNISTWIRFGQQTTNGNDVILPVYVYTPSTYYFSLLIEQTIPVIYTLNDIIIDGPYSVTQSEFDGIQNHKLFTGSGNVGIGTSSPSEKLHVVGNTKIEGKITSYRNEQSDIGLTLINDNGQWASGITLQTPNESWSVLGYGTGVSNSFGIRQNSQTGSTSIRFLIQTDGKVGIGTTTPSEKLHVQGNIKQDGNIYVQNNTVWHSGNVGPGSGLDQDTVDGKHQSYFADTSLSNVTDNTILNKIKNVDGSGSGLDQDLIDGIHQVRLFTLNYDKGTDWVPQIASSNSWNKVQSVQIQSGDSYISFASSSGKLHLFVDGDVYQNEGNKQLQYNDLSNVTDTTILNKVKNVDGQNSGLDQDLLDGKQGVEYLKVIRLNSNGNSTVYNKIGELRGQSTTAGAELTFEIQNVNDHGYLDRQTIIVHASQRGSNGIKVEAFVLGNLLQSKEIQVGYVQVGTFDFDIWLKRNPYNPCLIVGQDSTFNGRLDNFTETTTEPTGIVYVTPYKIWNENNDGQSSGLDQDLLDGMESSTQSTPNTIVQRDQSGNINANTVTATTFNGNLSGNQTTADKLKTQRTISLSGDVSGSVSFDGSQNVTISSILQNSGVTQGTYTKVTVDQKGRVTSGTTLSQSDIPNLDQSKITSGTLPIQRGGTNNTTYTQSKFLIYNGTSIQSSTYDQNSFVQNVSGTVPSIQSGQDQSKPSQGTQGRLYIQSDTGLIYRDNGTQWTVIGSVYTQGTGIDITNYQISLQNSGVTQGTYTKVTVDQKGRVTSGTTLSQSDIPNLDQSKITSGTLPIQRGGTNNTTYTSNKFLIYNGTSIQSSTYDQNSFVQNVSGTVPSIQSGQDQSKPTQGTQGRLYVQNDTGLIYLDNGTQWIGVGGKLYTQGTGIDITNYQISLQDSGATQGTYTKVTVDQKGRVTSGTTLSQSDIPSLDQSKITSGTLSVQRGGTGQSSFTQNKLLVGNGTSAIYSQGDLTWDSTNNRLGIGTQTPSSKLEIANGSIRLQQSGFEGQGQIQCSGTVKFANGSQQQEIYVKQISVTDSWTDQDTNKVTNGVYTKGGIKTQGQITSTVTTGTAPFVVSSTTLVTNLNSDLLDGYHAGNSSGQIPISNGTLCTNLNQDKLDGIESTDFIKNTTTKTSVKTNLSVGWYTIAKVLGNGTSSPCRAVARFALKDTQSGRHQEVVFYATHMYGTDQSNTITVLSQASFVGTPFRYIRIKEQGTYDGAVLQVYIDDATNTVQQFILGDNFQDDGWVIEDWTPDQTAPSGVTNYTSFAERVRVDLDLSPQGGIITSGNIYGNKVYGQVYNDYQEYRLQDEEVEQGYVVVSTEKGTVELCHKDRQKNIQGVVSDVFGFQIGYIENKQKKNLPIQVQGRVLVYQENKEKLRIGDPVVQTKEGKVRPLKWWEKIILPWIQGQIVGYVDEFPTYEEWGTNKVKVNGRIWIRL